MIFYGLVTLSELDQIYKWDAVQLWQMLLMSNRKGLETLEKGVREFDQLNPISSVRYREDQMEPDE